MFLSMFKNQRRLNMDKKEDLQQILESLSEEELSTLSTLLGKATNKPRNRRRGSGKRKQKKKSKPPTSPTPDIVDDLQLTPEEQKELKEASKFDKEKGLDKPKKHGTMISGRKYEKVSIQCMECKKTFNISPSLIPLERDRYKCNPCICRGRNR